MAGAPSGHVCGIDNSPEMVALARSATDAAAVGNVEIRNGLMEALPISAASIDWVIANCAINQSADKPQVFAEIARVLRLGGRLRIADVFADGLGDWVGGDASLRGSCLAGAATEAECIAGLTRVGLADLAVGGRYVYDQVQLAAMVAGPSERPTDRLRAADFAAAAVGGVWRAYVNARKPEKKTTAQAGSASQQTASGSVAQRKGARRHDRLP